MPTVNAFHGANAEKMLYNVMNGSLTADAQGQIFLDQHDWRNCLMHGTDRNTSESYVVKVTVEFGDDVRLERRPVHGNPNAVILHLAAAGSLATQFHEMYVRSGRVGSFEIRTVPGEAIQSYLMNTLGR